MRKRREVRNLTGDQLTHQAAIFSLSHYNVQLQIKLTTPERSTWISFFDLDPTTFFTADAIGKYVHALKMLEHHHKKKETLAL